MAFNWLEAFELAVQEAAAIEAVAVEVNADQPAASPPVYPTLDGHKYEAVLTLTPVPGA